MDIIANSILGKLIEYLFNNWKVECMIALIAGLIVYFVMKFKLDKLKEINEINKKIITQQNKTYEMVSKNIFEIQKDTNELKQVAIKIKEENDNDVLLENIEKIIEAKINNKQSN